MCGELSILFVVVNSMPAVLKKAIGLNALGILALILLFGIA